ncbi:nitroreductase family protein [Paracoccus xiamenensis]|uniref:nitroreductase family protein n=1 Tax=Paracoccus xiamenensis TaxID=2714901 RepID=UPI0014081B21|nr:nitroreductase family protein [Paracoccus xiamenensis]NHF73374.1 nitroreductase [Paracoccus xiamenensis]
MTSAPLPAANSAALDFLRSRRSHPPALLTGPGPDDAALTELLTLAARAPDHGKLEPWRFIILRDAALARLAPLVEAASARAGNMPEKAKKHGDAFRVPVVVAVVFTPAASDKVPEWEQFLSTGAVCLGLVNAALASGYGASWLTGVAAAPDFAQAQLDLTEGERIAGFIHIGARRDAPPPDRPRPDIAAKTTVLK